MKMRGLLGFTLAAGLTGCDFLSNPAAEYKQTCWGDSSNNCASMLVDTNIELLERFREDTKDHEEDIVFLYGEDGYKATHFLIDKLIEDQEERRPGFFARWVFGEAQTFEPNSNLLMSASDFKEIQDAIKAKFGKTAQETARPSEPETDPAADPVSEQARDPVAPPVPDVAVDPVSTPEAQLGNQASANDVISRRITEDPDLDGGSEYPDARQIISGDFSGEGIADAVVLYTIEGAGGSNSAFQKLALFQGAANGTFSFTTDTIVNGSATGLKVIDEGRPLIGLVALTHGPDDADCCPSMESIRRYRLDLTGQLLEVPAQ